EGKRRPSLRQFGPVGKTLAPPRVVLRDGMKLGQYERKQLHQNRSVIPNPSHRSAATFMLERNADNSLRASGINVLQAGMPDCAPSSCAIAQQRRTPR